MAAAAPQRMASAMKKFLPMFDRVLVQKYAAATKSHGGIYIPEKAQEKVLRGVVSAVGPGSRNTKGEIVPCSVNVGDDVLLPEYGGIKINMDNEDYFIYRDSDILGRFDS